MAETPVRIEDLLAERTWLRSLAGRLVADAGTADDLVQETWLTAITRPPRHRRGLRGWLATVLRNRAHDARLRERRATRRAERSGCPAPPDDPAEIVARAELEQRVARMTLDLPPEQRDALLLRYHRGLSSAEIAERLGLPAGTVRSRIKRGLDRLRERLDQDHDGDRREWMVALLPILRPAAQAGGPIMTAAPKIVAVALVVLAVSIPTTAVILARSAEEPAVEVLAAEVPARAAAAAGAEPAEDLVAGSPPAAPAAPAGDAGAETKKRPSILDRKVDLKLEGATLVEALERLRAEAGLAYELEPTLPERGTELNASVSGISVRNALDLIGELGGVEWVEKREGLVYLRPKPLAPRPSPTVPAPWFGGRHGLFRPPTAPEAREVPAIDLPEGDLVSTLSPGDEVEVRVAADGAFLLGGRPIDPGFGLWLALLDRPDATVVVHADAKAPILPIDTLRSRLPGRDFRLALDGSSGLPFAARGDAGTQVGGELRAFLTTDHLPLDGEEIRRRLWPCWKGADGRRLRVDAVLPGVATVADYAILVNEQHRFGLDLIVRLVGQRTSGRLGLTFVPPKGIVLSRDPVPSPRPGVPLGPPIERETRAPGAVLIEGRGVRLGLRAGGGAGTQAAVHRALAWLASRQRKDGSWNGDVEDTARAVLASLAGGEIRSRGPGGVDAIAGLAWLEARDAPSGPATMALAEAYALTGDPRWRRAASVAAARARSGLALRIARFCGVPVTFRREAVAEEDATSCLIRVFDGETPARSESLARAMNAFLEPARDAPDALLDAEDDLLHDGSLAAFQAGGEAWTHWNRALKRAVVDTQVREGENAGSWDPPEGGSRVRTTALRTATLTVYFRYRRLFSD